MYLNLRKKNFNSDFEVLDYNKYKMSLQFNSDIFI